MSVGPQDRLSVTELGRLLPDRPAEVVHAIWLATGGRARAALDLAAGATHPDKRRRGYDSERGDPVAVLALRAPSRAEFLAPDITLIRLLETAAARPLPGTTRARVLIRLARELLGDPSAEPRRHALVAEAERLGRAADDAGTLAEVLDGRLHALWDPAAARDRLDTAAEIVALARQAGDPAVELRGLFWRFTALAELGDLRAAEAALVTYARTGELVGDPEAAVVALSRQAVFALVRGRFELAATLAGEVTAAGTRAGLADTGRLTAMLHGMLAMLHGEANAQVAPLRDLALRLPGHFFEATAARALTEAGRHTEAQLELERLLPTVLAGGGPRWLGAIADLAFVATANSAEPVTSAEPDLVAEPARNAEPAGSTRPAGNAEIVSNTNPAGAAEPMSSAGPASDAELARRTEFVSSAGPTSGAEPEALRRLYEALAPYQGRLVVWGGANMITGTVDDLLGRLARRLGRPAEALAHLDRAVKQSEQLGALPWLAATLAARDRPGDRQRAHDLATRLGLGPNRLGLGNGRHDSAEDQPSPSESQHGPSGDRHAPDAPQRPSSSGSGGASEASGVPTLDLDLVAAGGEWRMSRDGDDWVVEAGDERARLRDVRGLHFLRLLVAAPGREIEALDLVAGGAGLRVTPPEPVLDQVGRDAYRRRLTELDAELDAADLAGDVTRAAAAGRERSALVAALKTATGIGGRARRPSAEAERARVNATRAIGVVLRRLEVSAPIAAAHLRASLRTGGRFRYQPAPGGPARWRV